MTKRRTALLGLAWCLLMVGCAHVPSYQLSFNERSRVLPASPAAVTDAVVATFEARDYVVTHVDRERGLVYTQTKLVGGEHIEVGGTKRCQWTAMVEEVVSGSLVSVQFVVEDRKAGVWVDSPVEMRELRTLYIRFFRDLESQLALGET